MTWLLVGVYAVSGFSALLYQVVWQRWLIQTVGLSTVAVSLVVSAFLAGLGLGYLGGGRLADRLSPRAALAAFAALELGIAGSALASQSLLYGWLPTLGQLGPHAPWTTFLVVLVVLALPTAMMGASLPVLTRAFVLPSALEQSGFIARLYFANTFGGACSALVAMSVLVPWLGFDGAVRVAAGGNLTCALVGLAIGRRVSAARPEPTDTDLQAGPRAPAAPTPSTWAWRGWLAHAFIAGLAGIAWEILAFRVIDNVVKPQATTFAYVLGIFLSGLALGSLAGDLLRERLGQWRRSAFLASQVAAFFTMASGLVLLTWAVDSWLWLEPWRDHMASYEPRRSSWLLRVLNRGVLPGVLLFVPGTLMGLGFSLSQQLLQTSLASVGWRLGRIQFVNVLGCVAGGLGTALVALPALGTAGSVRGLTLLGCAYGLVWWYEGRRRLAPSLVLLGLVAAAIAVPSNRELWTVLSGTEPQRLLVREGMSGVSSIRFTSSQQAHVFSNGLGQSTLPRTADAIHIRLGAVPMLVHPAPRRIGIVGLGSGGTAWAAGARPETTTQVVWELMEEQPALLADYARLTGFSAVDWFARDPRVRLEYADGRQALLVSSDRFDIIEADALRPGSAHSGNLYSKEFFALVRSRLAVDGLAATWIPTARVLRTFRQVFPHVIVVDDLVALGSDTPIVIDRPTIQARLRGVGLDRRFIEAGIDLEALLGPPLASLTVLPPLDPLTREDDINTDMRPRDELPIVRWGANTSSP